ncbi:NAD(P)-dependent dehydrogenase, short-chain alcohol dehydrogenase family [Halomicrobium zhouii]|uniref:NAD(P)-dependent dehydrogenase, short-chain alcohol dehydrogenase family n=1 Tax=Halomicrobium zhouii TaxID=767519 RepID=A0A1I6L5A0_9EURY|nr:oxidoreductase [Halomicrobium zhouii]SFR98616.1 NAD(P)-dependent dehydrogenase, short-chain alcohol dehydrogenase family [Halomicrobium zhouii]
MSDDWTADDVPAMDGEVVIVTGANSGIGYEAARVFADRGATVVMACRSVDRGERAAGEIRADVPDADLDVRECDLGDLSAVTDFANVFTDDYDELRVLCNNAGVMAIPRSETADGFETQFGVNHLGHFALTGHLLDALADTPGESRVVTQSSGVHERGTIDFEDLQHEKSYDKWAAYAQSKLANVLFGYELDDRLGEHGVDGVTSVVCHPGYADTNLQIRTGEASGSTLRLWAMKAANYVFAQPAEMGALPMLFAATSEEVIGGEYVGPVGLFDMRGHPGFQRSSEESYDQAVAERLWDVSEDLTGVAYDFG